MHIFNKYKNRSRKCRSVALVFVAELERLSYLFTGYKDFQRFFTLAARGREHDGVGKDGVCVL
jgi:hypothetical protein